MNTSNTYQANSKLDLSFERVVDVPKKLVWRAWTEPDLIKHWFTPAPWKTVDCEIDLRPGGIFRTVIFSPEAQELPHIGCYLEVVENEKLVWTNALAPGFRPMSSSAANTGGILDFFFTAMIALSTHGSGTKYTATVIHADEASCRKHADMGFREGWGKALEQLVAYSRSM